jgi:hypothetical protein
MDKDQRHTIRWKEIEVQGNISGDFIGSKWKSSTLSTKHTKRYHIGLIQMMHLSRCSILLFMYAAEVMDDENLFINDNQFKENFNKLIARTGDKPYSLNYINKSILELKFQELVLPQHRRGLYQVHPLYMCNSDEDARKELMQSVMNKPFQEQVSKAKAKLFSNKIKRRNRS